MPETTAKNRALTGEGGAGFPVNPPLPARDELGNDANTVRVRRIPLDNTFSEKKIKLEGNVLWAIEATSLAATVKVKFNDQENDPIPYGVGQVISGITFGELYLTNDTAQPGESITFFAAIQGPRNINLENPQSSASAVNVNSVNSPGTLATNADQSVAASTSTQVLAADANRREAILTNLSSNGAAFRIGDANVGASRGIELPVGSTVYLETTAAVHVYNTNGSSAQDIAVQETTY